METKIYIGSPPCIGRTVRMLKCPNCGSNQKFICEFYEWYGVLTTCLTCGDSFSDGECLPRPCAKGWRLREVAKAKKKLSNLFPLQIV